jgi:hypothetical protein
MKKKLSFPSVFFGVFFHPRETVKKVIKQKYYSFVMPFIVFYTLVAGFDPMLILVLSKYVPFLVALPLVVFLMALIGFGSFYLSAWLIFRIGKNFGGKGKLQPIQAAFALAYSPILMGCILKFLVEIPNWYKFFSNMDNLSSISAADLQSINSLASLPVIIFCIWMLFPWIINISEAHQYSKWKAFKTHLTIVGIFFAVFAVLAVVGLILLLILRSLA